MPDNEIGKPEQGQRAPPLIGALLLRLASRGSFQNKRNFHGDTVFVTLPFATITD